MGYKAIRLTETQIQDGVRPLEIFKGKGEACRQAIRETTMSSLGNRFIHLFDEVLKSSDF
jgi:hypothetical protein